MPKDTTESSNRPIIVGNVVTGKDFFNRLLRKDRRTEPVDGLCRKGDELSLLKEGGTLFDLRFLQNFSIHPCELYPISLFWCVRIAEGFAVEISRLDHIYLWTSRHYRRGHGPR